MIPTDTPLTWPEECQAENDNEPSLGPKVVAWFAKILRRDDHE